MSKTYNEALLQRVEEYLASSGLSQNKMAQAVGLSQTALSNWRRKIQNPDFGEIVLEDVVDTVDESDKVSTHTSSVPPNA
jgi:transcriptional regulator with XRE-family HTH domain